LGQNDKFNNPVVLPSPRRHPELFPLLGLVRIKFRKTTEAAYA